MNVWRGWRAVARALIVTAVVAIPVVIAPNAGAGAPPPGINCGATQSTAFNSQAAVAIPDATPAPMPGDPDIPGAPATSATVVSGLTGSIQDLDLSTAIPHAAPGHLVIRLTSPSGKIADISVQNGGTATNAFNGTGWDDDADPDGVAPYTTNDGLVTDHAYVAGVVATPLVPEEGLAVFVGDDPNGVWTLTVTDAVAGATGTLNQWGLTVTTQAGTSATRSTAANSRVSLPIPDGGTVSSQVLMANTSNGLVRAVTMGTQISHPDSGDLLVTLTSPAGTSVTLTAGWGAGSSDSFSSTNWSQPRGAYVGTGFPDPVSLVTFPASTPLVSLAPQESFGAFYGEDPAGLWTLTVSDTVSNGLAGVLSGWSLGPTLDQPCQPQLEVTATPPPASVRIGTSLSWDVTARNVGLGFAPQITISGSVPNLTRILAMTPSPGGACQKGLAVFCTWSERTAPGATRTVRLTVEPYIVGTTTVQWQALPGTLGTIVPIVARTPASTPLTAMALLPASTRAANGRRCMVLGTPRNDIIRPPKGLLGAAGVYCGLGGNDTMTGSDLAETFDGGPGADVIRGGGGRDDLSGGPGADILRGEDGRDILRGGAGRDRLVGGAGLDVLIGGLGRDLAVGAGDRVIGVEARR